MKKFWKKTKKIEKAKGKLKLHEKKEFLGLPRKHRILLFSGMAAVLLVFFALLLTKSGDTLRGVLIGLGVMVAFIPYSLTTYFEKNKIVEMEKNLPAFLRDIAEARKTGMTLPQAVYKSAKVDYGKLSPEVSKMATQISWGIPFEEVLRRFSSRVESRFIERSIAIIIEAQVSGGAMVDTLDAVARDARLIKESEKERKSKLNQQAMIMYAIFFLFLAIVVALQKLMIPLVTSGGFTLSAEDPIKILDFYKNLFFSMIVIQAIFNGLLAGQIAEGSAVIGLKHSAIFLTVGIVTSWFFIF